MSLFQFVPGAKLLAAQLNTLSAALLALINTATTTANAAAAAGAAASASAQAAGTTAGGAANTAAQAAATAATALAKASTAAQTVNGVTPDGAGNVTLAIPAPLVAGTNITIVDGVISASGGAGPTPAGATPGLTGAGSLQPLLVPSGATAVENTDTTIIFSGPGAQYYGTAILAPSAAWTVKTEWGWTVTDGSAVAVSAGTSAGGLNLFWRNGTAVGAYIGSAGLAFNTFAGYADGVSGSSGSAQVNITAAAVLWLGIKSDGTRIYAGYSYDNVTWTWFFSAPLTAFSGGADPSEYAVCLSSSSSSNQATLLTCKQSAP